MQTKYKLSNCVNILLKCKCIHCAHFVALLINVAMHIAHYCTDYIVSLCHEQWMVLFIQNVSHFNDFPI